MRIETLSLRPSIFITATLVAFLTGCASASTPSTASNKNAGSPSAITDTSAPEAALKEGMPAATVIDIMGKPAAIKPMESPTGVAQIWVYHRQTQGSVRQVQVGMKYIPIAGDDQLLSTVAEPVFRQQTEMIDETISLLMFNKHFVMAKKSVSKHTEFD